MRPRMKGDEIDANLARFREALPALQTTHSGEWAQMRGGDIVSFIRSAMEAQMAGNQNFEDGMFSIQQVQAEPDSLGYDMIHDDETGEPHPGVKRAFVCRAPIAGAEIDTSPSFDVLLGMFSFAF